MKYKLVILILLAILTNLAGQKQQASAQSKLYSQFPGSVANVFGWGYNRTSCYLSDIKDTIVFFYAEDQHIYYTYHSTPEVYYSLNTSLAVNPDFDVHCWNNQDFYITVSDPNQQSVYLIESKIIDAKVHNQKNYLVYTGESAYTAVAPHTRYLDGTWYVVFMEYGRTGSSTPNSKVFVSSSNDLKKWKTQALFEHTAQLSQVLGISLEFYQESLIAIINPPGESVFISKRTEQGWTVPKKQKTITIVGQLEWQSTSDEAGTYLVYMNNKNVFTYAKLINDTWYIYETRDSLYLNSTAIFKSQNQLYVAYSNSILRKVLLDGLSLPIVFGPPETNGLYFLKVPASIDKKLDYVWLGGKDGAHQIKYRSIDIPDNITLNTREKITPIVEPLLLDSDVIQTKVIQTTQNINNEVPTNYWRQWILNHEEQSVENKFMEYLYKLFISVDLEV
jgi:hypothetical protein